MKKIILVLVMIGSGISVYSQNEVKIDTSRSVLKWTGSNLFKFNKHYGTVKFNSGVFVIKNDSVIGGQFELDMNSIMNTEGIEMLVDHLKNKDFFNVSAYPTAKLEILSLEYKDANRFKVEANLTIKGVTKKIKYRTSFENTDEAIVMKSSFIIDRTRWGINFESKSFMKGLKDGAISDAIEFEVIVSSAQSEINQ